MAAAAVAAGVWTAGLAAHSSASAATTKVRPVGPHIVNVLPSIRATEHTLLTATALRPATASTTASTGTASTTASTATASTAAATAATTVIAATAVLTPRQIALSLLRRFGWSARQFPPLNLLWSRESSWRVHAENPYSGAYGIPQAVPGAKMSTAGPNWRTSARTQILWGLRYIKARYGSPAAAWRHELATGWY